MKMKQILSSLLSVAMIAGMFAVPVFAEESEEYITLETDESLVELAAVTEKLGQSERSDTTVCKLVMNEGTDGESTLYYDSILDALSDTQFEECTGTIYMFKDETIDDEYYTKDGKIDYNGPYVKNKVKITSIDSDNPCTIDAGKRKQPLLYTSSKTSYDVNVTLENIIIDGDSENGTKRSTSLIDVVQGATLNLNTGAVVQNSHVSTSFTYGAAMIVRGDGIVNMNEGSKITGCTLDTYSALGSSPFGAIYISGTFNMNGGEISNNRTSQPKAMGEPLTSGGGGAIFLGGGNGGGGIFIMNGGIITGNSAYNGGAIFLNRNASFKMTGGIITENTADAYVGGIVVAPWKNRVELSGNCVITGNISGEDRIGDNLYMDGNTTGDGLFADLYAGEFTDGANVDLYVYTQDEVLNQSDQPVVKPLVEGSKLTEKGLSAFNYEDQGCALKINENGEYYISNEFSMEISTSIGGSVTASADSSEESSGEFYKAGTKITLDTEPKKDYTLSGIRVVDAGGNEVEVENGAFIMPASDVKVYVSFRKVEGHTIIDAPMPQPPAADEDASEDVKEAAEALADWTAGFAEDSDEDETLEVISDKVDSNDSLYTEARDMLGDPNSDVYLHIVTDFALKVTGYDPDETTLMMDVSALRRIIASTSNALTDEQKENPNLEENGAELIRDSEKITVNEGITLSIPLPPALKEAKQIEITHGHGENAYKYVAPNENGIVTFTTHGLSPLTFKEYTAPTTVDGKLTSVYVSAGEGTIVNITEDTTDYSVDAVANGVKSTQIMPTFGDGVTVKVNGSDVKSGSETTVDLKPGKNVITIDVYDADDTTKIIKTYTIAITRNELKDMSVYFKQVSGSKRLYNIILKAGDGTAEENSTDEIHRLNSADLTFALNATGDIDYRIAPMDYINLIDAGEGRYEFNFKEGDNKNNTGNEIVIGTVEFLGYGTVTSFKVMSDGVDTNAVHPTTGSDNIVTDYTTAGGVGKGKLHITDVDEIEDDGGNYYGTITDVDLGVETKTVTVNVMFPNKLADDVDDKYIEDMTVTVKGGAQVGDDGSAEPFATTIPLTKDDAKEFKYETQETATEGANANGYQLSVPVPVPKDTGARYTFTFSGEGYRTYSVDAVIGGNDANPTVTVWNNVMDKGQNVVVINNEGQGEATVKTFLAGDIVEDNTINIYDLSAVVAYFGKPNKAGEDAAYKNYIQYDLNRDGQIDSKDIAMVLVSWGN